jgi:hypothetical protein
MLFIVEVIKEKIVFDLRLRRHQFDSASVANKGRKVYLREGGALFDARKHS